MKVQVGDTIPEWIMENVLPERMRTMAAILRDPNPLHWDREEVDKMGLGKHCINQGPLGLSYMVNMLHEWSGENSIRRIKMGFPKPLVLDGDRVVAQGFVEAINEENGDHIAVCHIWLDRDGERLLEGTAFVCLPQ